MTCSKNEMRAFTLIELLTVVSIMALMIAISSLPSLLGASAVNQAVGGISLLIEQARAYAMARNTYVWVGFADTTNVLKVGIVAGTTGQPDDLGTGNITLIEKVRAYENFRIEQVSGLTGMESNGDDIGHSALGSFTGTAGGVPTTFSKVLRFSPRGEAFIKPDSVSHCIDIGLVPVRGNQSNDINKAAFQVSALTGRVQVFRQ